MPRSSRVMEGLIDGSCKIRKRGCSTSSSSSSRVHNYRLKRAILVGKTRGGGIGGSRSTTPIPTWRMTPLRSAVESPRYSVSQSGNKSKPVSARKLAATLWEMNEMPSPRVSDKLEEKRPLRREKLGVRSVNSGSLPPHLSDPSHSPVSDRMDRSGMGSRQRRTSSTSYRWPTDHNVGVLDTFSNASMMEIETRSRPPTPSGSTVGVQNRLKDVSNALTTSKELLKIINRVWAQVEQPSSSMSLISALHAELERARLQVNKVIYSDQNEIDYLIKCFAEDKEGWKFKEKQAVEAAIESIAGELEVERKLRRRFESLNKKLGKELSDTKASFMKAVKELESEKRARLIMEQVCDDLAREDRAQSVKAREEVVEKQREMLSNILHEERVQKHHISKKNSAVDKLRKQLEAFLKTKRVKEKGCGSHKLVNDEEISAYSSRPSFCSRRIEGEENEGEVENAVDSAESDLQSIELNMDNSKVCRDFKRVQVDDVIKGGYSTAERATRKSTSLQRSMSDCVEWGNPTETIRNPGDKSDRERIRELEKQTQRKGCGNEFQTYISVKGLREKMLSSSGIGSGSEYDSPSRQREQSWPSRDPCGTMQGSGSKSRLGAVRGEGQNIRRSKW